jgi:hypothetical protein
MAETKESAEFKKKVDAYRAFLLDTEQKVQAEYDRTIVLLAGGGLGISLTILKDVVREKPLNHSEFLFAAWLAWSISLGITLISYYTGIQAIHKAVRQIATGILHQKSPGGFLNTLTQILNFLSGLLVIVGLLSLICFVYLNKPK